jgi:hypothetical protein
LNAEELGEPLDDPLLLLSVFYSFWVANYYLFDGNALRELALQFLTLAEKRRSQVPLMIGHRLMGVSLIATGDFAQGRAHWPTPALSKFAQHSNSSVQTSAAGNAWQLGCATSSL